MIEQASGVIRTTEGDLAPHLLGPTTMHEHLGVDVRAWYATRHPGEARFRDEAITMRTVPDARWSALSFMDNIVVDDMELITTEVAAFKRAGGSGLVEMGCRGLNRNPKAIAEIANATGVHIVLGCGYFAHSTHEPSVCVASIEELEAMLEVDVTTGVEGTSVLPGTLGEIGMSSPPEPCERRVLKAAARVARKYGMSVNVHVDYAGRYGAQHAIDCLEEGLPPDRIVIGHMDEQLDEGYQLRVLQLGVFIGLDTFGTDFYFSGIMKLPTDEQRIISLARLIDQGFAERIVLAQDVAFKTHFHAFGGFGYDHLLARIVPVLEHEYGIRQGVIDQLLVRNPRHLLTSTPPPWPG